MKKLVKRIASAVFGRQAPRIPDRETQLLAMGALLSNQQKQLSSTQISHYEFRIFSQFGDDGIIQYLVNNLEAVNKTFVEFGVENFLESNTRFLMMHSNWSGFVMDGSKSNMDSLTNYDWFWKYDLRCEAVFIDRDNINPLLQKTGFQDLGLLHIDLDGNDYHILEVLDFSTLNPAILIMEYNAVFGSTRPITVPYSKDFYRTKAHFSNLYFGASLPAITLLAEKKGYKLIGCNEAGNNAYFIRKDLLNERIRATSVESAFREARFRESRDQHGSLSLLRSSERQNQIQDMEVINVVTGQTESIGPAAL